MSFTYKDDILHCEDVALNAIGDKYGTPSYVYSTAIIERNYSRLKRAFIEVLPETDHLIAYACKANSTLAVLSTLAKLGSGADIVSGGEMTRAITAGISPGKIVFSGVGKTRDEIMAAIDHQIAQINIESEAEMDLIARVAKECQKQVNISFRLNPDVDAKTNSKITTGKKDSKFGITPAIIRELYKKANEHPYLKPKGLSVHIGSQLTSLEPFRDAFKIVADFTKDLISEGMPVETLDLGGGIGIIMDKDDTLFDLKDYMGVIKETIAPLNTKLILEPGRFITGDAGILLTKVLYFKQASEKAFLIVDAGMTDFMRPSLYDAEHPAQCITETAETHKTYDIVGPVCETSDVLAKDVRLPENVEEPGSLIAFMQTGAYGSVMASAYNARSLPSEILTKGSCVEQIRRRLTVQDILKTENVPDWV